MTQRSESDWRPELQDINASHLANEAQRDALVALGHTALFAASIAFIGGVEALKSAHGLGFLCGAWGSSVIGLFALTLSFELAKRCANDRRKAIHDQNAPHGSMAELSNSVALWTFPLSMTLLTIFAVVNIYAK